jgi:hypothetical protein
MSDTRDVVAMPGASPPGASGSSARDFLQRLEQALNNLVTLKVVTLVGPVNVTGAGTDVTVAIAPGAAPEAASTEVNLLDGDITNTFSTGFSAIASGAMSNFHQSQVEKSQTIVTSNLAEIQKLATALISAARR